MGYSAPMKSLTSKKHREQGDDMPNPLGEQGGGGGGTPPSSIPYDKAQKGATVGPKNKRLFPEGVLGHLGWPNGHIWAI